MRIFLIVIMVSVWIMLAFDFSTFSSILKYKQQVQNLEDRLNTIENNNKRSDL